MSKTKSPRAKFKLSKSIALEVRGDDEKDEFVPDKHEFIDQKLLLAKIAIAINHRMPVLMIGETGSGKTSLVRYLAAMTNNGYRRVNHNGGTTVEDIVGKILVSSASGTYWVDGVLLDAMRKGHWYLADEINAASAEINFVYHSLLDDDGYVVLAENNGEIIRPHPDFRFFGAMNPVADYAGTKELNKALMSRFVVFKVDFPSPQSEIKILEKRTGIEEKVAERMVKFAVNLRGQHSAQKIQYIPSTRDLLQWAQMYTVFGKYMVSSEMTILNKVDYEDSETVKDLLNLTFKALDEPSLSKEAKQQMSEGENSFTEGFTTR